MAEGRKEATFHARQSGRVATSITTDHDIWVERLAVVDMLVPNAYSRTGEEKYELQIRSFFESQLSGQKCWDEPPSGAESIQYANDEMRRMAEMQKRDLQCTHLPTDATNDSRNNDSGTGGRKKIGNRVKKLFQRRNRSGEIATSSGRSGREDRRQIGVREDSLLADFLNGSSEVNPDYNPNEANLEYALAQSLNNESDSDNFGQIDSRTDLERAIALSVTETQGRNRRNVQEEEEEEIALATALSLSLNEASQSSNNETQNDEALEEPLVDLLVDDGEVAQSETSANLIHQEKEKSAAIDRQLETKLCSVAEDPELAIDVSVPQGIKRSIHQDGRAETKSNPESSSLVEMKSSTELPDSFELV